MTTRAFLALIFGILALPCAEAADPRHQVDEVQAKRISDAEYEAVLQTARRNGWIYPADQVESGHKRHYREFQMRLRNRGYEIVPAGTFI